MKRKAVESSNLASIGYDEKTKILEIEFNHGGVYEYYDVEKKVYEELMNADLHGVIFITTSATITSTAVSVRKNGVSDDFKYLTGDNRRYDGFNGWTFLCVVGLGNAGICQIAG